MKDESGSKLHVIQFDSIKSKYEFLDNFWKSIRYFNLVKKDKIICLQYLVRVTGLKRSRILGIFTKIKDGKPIGKKYVRRNVYRKYTASDIKLLEKTDEVHLRLSARSTKAIFKREYQVFGKSAYKRLSQISSSHIDNLRRSPIYKSSWSTHTQARVVPIGETRKPVPNGKPGYIRVDSVNQKEIYYINLVDEVTQWEVVVAVAQITNWWMSMALAYIMEQVPFVIHNFHSDRGSENINYKVARMLKKLHIRQTKSRSRQHNDNALIEGKNGSVIRKNFGYGFFPKQALRPLNYYLRNYFTPYLNYHRPCLFPTTITLSNGRTCNKYLTSPQTPFEKLWELAGKNHHKYFKKSVKPLELFDFAHEFSDNEFAQATRSAERELFTFVSSIIRKRKGKT